MELTVNIGLNRPHDILIGTLAISPHGKVVRFEKLPLKGIYFLSNNWKWASMNYKGRMY